MDSLLNSLVTVMSVSVERKKDALCKYSYNRNIEIYHISFSKISKTSYC